MKVLRNIWDEAIGLFVDDWVCAVSVLGWVAFYVFVLLRFVPALGAPGLLIGLVVVPLIFVVRQTRKTVGKR